MRKRKLAAAAICVILCTGCGNYQSIQKTEAQTAQTTEVAQTAQITETAETKETVRELVKETGAQTQGNQESAAIAVNPHYLAMLNRNADAIIAEEGQPDYDGRKSEYPFWTNQVIYRSETPDELWLEVKKQTSAQGVEEDQVYFVSARADLMFQTQFQQMRMEDFVTALNLAGQYQKRTVGEEDFQGDNFFELGAVDQEVLEFTKDGYQYEVTLDQSCITSQSYASVRISSGYEEYAAVEPNAENGAGTASAVRIVPNEAVETEVSSVRKIWNADQSKVDSHAFTTRSLGNGGTAYLESGVLHRIELPKGVEGMKNSRNYTYQNGKLIFAFYAGNGERRMYLHEGQMFRMRYTADPSHQEKVDVYDNTVELEEYRNYESLVLQDADRWYGVAENEPIGTVDRKAEPNVF